MPDTNPKTVTELGEKIADILADIPSSTAISALTIARVILNAQWFSPEGHSEGL